MNTGPTAFAVVCRSSCGRFVIRDPQSATGTLQICNARFFTPTPDRERRIAECGYRIADADILRPMPLASWLFIKDGQSIWIERPYGLTMIVAGPGSAREQHEFPDEKALEAFQVAIGERLTSAGWFLWGFDRERRSGRDRRNMDRRAPDRRQPITSRTR